MPKRARGIHNIRGGIYEKRASGGALSRRAPRRTRYKKGAILAAIEMTEYALRHKLRNAWGILDEDEIKETISYAADYWRLEVIDISEFSHVADPEYRNRSIKAYPIVHYFNTDRDGQVYCDVLDGIHRIAMARARGETSILAWVGHMGAPLDQGLR